MKRCRPKPLPSDAALSGSNGLYIKAPGTWDLIYARNNIWAGTDYAIHNYNTSQSVDLDYDNLYNAGLNDLVRWDGTRYATLAAFSAATGLETHGVNVAPGFQGADQGDYTLAATSDLIDAGLLIPGINATYSGLGPDIGAFEADRIRPHGKNTRCLNASMVRASPLMESHYIPSKLIYPAPLPIISGAVSKSSPRA